jgi:pimeloyl-ACP methyl ester carboxylesterase
MPPILRIIIRAAALVLACLVGYYAWKNPEKSALDAKARAGAPGAFVTLSHGVTHYEVAGPDTGRVVVLVHGFSVPYYIWDSTFVALKSAGYRVIRYDLYGRGLSDRPDVTYDGTLFDAQLDGLLDSLRVTQPIDLMGLSFGGYVTAHYVDTHGKRVRTLTLFDPVAEQSHLPEALTMPIVGNYLWQTMHVPTMADNQASDFLHPEHFPGWADRYRPQMRYNGFGRALLSSAATLSNTDLKALYGGVARAGVPLMLIWGKQDSTVSIRFSNVVRGTNPGVEFFPVDSAGHLPHLEQTTLVNARLLAFLAAHAVK